MTTSGPLEGIRVVELARDVTAASCARHFAAWGAEVVVAEPGGPSRLRTLGSKVAVAGGADVPILWEWIAGNKRAVATTSDMELRVLLGSADLLVTDYGAHLLRDMGIRLDGSPDDFPNLIVVSITPFGLSGPYAGFQGSTLVVEALSGYLGLNGLAEREPLRAPGRITSYAVGANGFAAALAAWLKYARTGVSERVEVSAMETVASMVPFLQRQYSGVEKRREGGTEGGVRLLPCRDGWLSVAVNAPALKTPLCETLGIDEAALPQGLYDGAASEIIARTVAFYSQFTRTWNAEDLFLAFTVGGVTCGKAMRLEELLALEPLTERNFFQELDHPRLGRLMVPGPAGFLPGLAHVRPSPAPAPDEQVAVSALNWAPRPPRSQHLVDASSLPLANLKILDLTQAWIGPFTTLLLADLGADVIKIEGPRRPDIWRSVPTRELAFAAPNAAPLDRSWAFNSVNLNKRDLTLDLRSAEGRSLFLRLAAQADVVAENFTPTVMDGFGLAYPALAAVRPDLVMLSSSGFGKTGLWSLFKTNGSAIEALAGWDSLHAYPGADPVLMGFYQADALDGFQMAALTLVGLVHRERTGTGVPIDAAMLDASVGYLGELLFQAQLGDPPAPIGNRSPDMAPHGIFPCAGDDRWIAIAVTDDLAWQGLTKAFDIAEPRWDTLEGRLAAQPEIEDRIASHTRSWDADALMLRLQALGIPSGVVRKVGEALTDPHLTQRRWFRNLERSDLGTQSYNGTTFRFARSASVPQLPPPRLGEHSEVLLGELLGAKTQTIAALKASEVTSTIPTVAGSARASHDFNLNSST